MGVIHMFDSCKLFFLLQCLNSEMLIAGGTSTSIYWQIGCLDASTQSFFPLDLFDQPDPVALANFCASLFGY